jgi:hypothetical protein
LDKARQLGLSRRRTGATTWVIDQAAEDPSLWIEAWSVPTWAEHVAQHQERLTGFDAELTRAVGELSLTKPQVRHLVPPGALLNPPDAVPPGAKPAPRNISGGLRVD